MKRRMALFGILAVALAGCPKDKKEESLTVGQALQAVEEASVASQAQSLTSGSVEIATNFTIGQAVEAAAMELRDFIASQLPCADISLTGATLTVEYGVNAGNCTYRGHTYSGSHSITVSRNDEGEVLVEHAWDDLSNGKLSVTGDATVTWSLADKSRHVVHTATWTRLRDGRTGTGSGDRTQTVLEGGLFEGISVEGSRSWQGQAGQWDLAISGVEMRWVDPVPQAGSYNLGTPFGRSVSLSFSRVDEDTIAVTVSSGDKSFSFDVSKLGGVQQS